VNAAISHETEVLGGCYCEKGVVVRTEGDGIGVEGSCCEGIWHDVGRETSMMGIAASRAKLVIGGFENAARKLKSRRLSPHLPVKTGSITYPLRETSTDFGRPAWTKLKQDLPMPLP
jgi:hypothetical protein